MWSKKTAPSCQALLKISLNHLNMINVIHSQVLTGTVTRQTTIKNLNHKI